VPATIGIGNVRNARQLADPATRELIRFEKSDTRGASVSALHDAVAYCKATMKLTTKLLQETQIDMKCNVSRTDRAV